MRLETFQPQVGVHCETTTLRNMLHHAGARLSEPLLFGLGQGIDFQYWDPPVPGRSAPMLTGRIGPGDLSHHACAALGVELRESRPPDADSARARTAELLAAGHVVGVTVDIYHLDYFSSRSHFASHYIALYGLDDDLDGGLAYVVDTDQQGGARTLPGDSLRRARSSDEGFLPSPNLQMHIGGLPKRLTTDGTAVPREQIWKAIRDTAARMLSDRGPKRGLSGLHKAASDVCGWNDTLTPGEELVPGVGRFWRYAGTGGANFRALYRDFLREARQRTGDAALDAPADAFDGVRHQWDEAIDLLLGHGEAPDPHGRLKAVEALLHAIADAERSAFERLLQLATERVGESP
ncbi:BtrH N-terminal domain-containing protein [Streptomyces sp. NRRL B-1347]|uniref:BtrH N-terminal domain-containing protein n=1 Tax=Streptomyces sp. NRRL B-1347 TaxID=1476877 RepID=UPI00099C9923|nr:BtrH N-terminal domain-containing protein [Streptomyces sp. NRRL B-1347]